MAAEAAATSTNDNDDNNDAQPQPGAAATATAEPSASNNNNKKRAAASSTTTATTSGKRKRGAAAGGGGGSGSATTATAATKKAAASRSSGSRKKKEAGTGTGTAKKQQQQKQPPVDPKQQQKQPQQLPPTPARTLILDNGGDTIKYGWSTASTANNNNNSNSTMPIIHRMPNVTARLPQQLTVLVGDQVEQLQNPNSVLSLQRSTERSVIANLGNQVQVWKRILDRLGVVIVSNASSTAAAAFGWKAAKDSGSNNKDKDGNNNNNNNSTKSKNNKILAHNCAVLLALPPHYPHNLLDHIVTVWMEDFGFGRVGFCLSAAVAAHVVDRPPALPKISAAHLEQQDDTKTSTTTTTKTTTAAAAATPPQIPIACVVDLGWSATHIVPVYGHHAKKPISARAIRRLPLGGRHLINLWKYYTSYRQWNMMDQEWVMRQVLEQTAFVSLQFATDVRHTARRLPAGRRPYDVEFVLPDYDATRTGTVQIPLAVRQQREKEEQRRRRQQQQNGDHKEDEDEDDDYDEEMDEDFTENDARDEEDENDENLEDLNAAPMAEQGDDDDDDDEEEDSDDDDESPEQLRRRLLKEREEEERRRRELEAEQQILNVSVERFCIPEVLFRPSDAGLPTDWANLAQAVAQSIEACPVIYRAGLYQSIQLTGGLSQLPRLAERLEREVRALAPAQYKIVRVTEPHCLDGSKDAPVEAAWRGANQLVARAPSCLEWSISRDEWESASKRGAWKRLLLSEGGFFV